MNRNDKIEEIVEFVTNYPECTASRAILRRYYLNNYNYETSKELGFELKDVLNVKNKDEIEFCFYLVK
ncbi:MAG: hypothetical protein ACOC1O_01705 [bacterium]